MINLKQDLVDILCDLIRVESVTGNEKALCDVLFETLSPYAGELIRENNSLIFNLKYGKENTIALIGHIDTVPIGNSTTEAYIKDDAIWGRGACDMKSGLASMLKVIEQIDCGVIQPVNNVSFIFYEGEEGPAPNGINLFLNKNILKDINFAYVLEPSEGNYSVGCLGSLAVKKEIFGVSAHSANPKTGVNALNDAMIIFEKIKEMDKLIGEMQHIDNHEFYETVNVTSLNTFNAFNVLPPRAELVVNYRFRPGRSIEEAKNFLYSYLGEDGITILDEVGSCYIGSDNKIFLIEGIKSEIMQAWTDMAQLNEAGIPAINFGPGSIKLAHKPDERITILEFKEFYNKLIKHL
jgi:succinyl-diaminopimelate desuccinylase